MAGFEDRRSATLESPLGHSRLAKMFLRDRAAHRDPVGRTFACADGRAYFGAVREPVPRADVRACAATDYYPSDADADDVQDLLL